MSSRYRVLESQTRKDAVSGTLLEEEGLMEME
jgi:hypothetical protein